MYQHGSMRVAAKAFRRRFGQTTYWSQPGRRPRGLYIYWSATPGAVTGLFQATKMFQDTAMPNPRTRLPLVAPGQELTGHHPVGFERAAKGSALGDRAHRALIFAGVTLARRAVVECLSPGVRPLYLEALDAAWRWALKPKGDLRATRARCFDFAQEAEAKTVAAIGNALSRMPPLEETPLTTHAALARDRYIGLAVHHATAAVVLLLDACRQPAEVLPLPGEVSGAVAYKKLALGACRNPELHQAALQQAEWESARVLSSQAHSAAGLRLQLLHEYLGVHWKNLADAQRIYLEEFLAWAFADRP